MSKWLFIFSLIITHSFSIIAQVKFKDGFIITHEGDTIYGQLDYRGNYKDFAYTHFKKASVSEVKKYLPTDIKAYSVKDTKFFLSKDILIDGKTKTAFLEYLLNGIVDLYFYQQIPNEEKYFIEYDGKIDELKDEIITKVIADKKYNIYTHGFRNQLKSIFASQPRLASKIDSINYTKKEILDVTTRFHALCSDDKCIEYKAIQKPISVKITVHAGLSIIGTTITNEYHSGSSITSGGMIDSESYYSVSEKNSSQKLMGGISIEFKNLLNAIGERFSIETGLFYIPRKIDLLQHYYYTRKVDNVVVESNRLNDGLISIEENLLKTVIGLKYTYPSNLFRPSISFGLRRNFIISREVLLKPINPGSRSDYLPSYVGNPRKPRSAYLNLGGEIALSSKSILINVILESYRSLQNDFYFNEFALLIGYRF